MDDWRALARRASELRVQMLPFDSQGTIPVEAFTHEENAALRAAVDRVLAEAAGLEARAKEIRGW